MSTLSVSARLVPTPLDITVQQRENGQQARVKAELRDEERTVAVWVELDGRWAKQACAPARPVHELDDVDLVPTFLAGGNSREVSCLTPEVSPTGGVIGVVGYFVGSH